MHLQTIDFVIIIGFLVVMVGLGLVFARRAGKSVDEFFISGRALPWWLAGISMVATGFAIDTPLGITGLVASHGIQGVWFAWSFILGATGALGAFIFAQLLRRSRIITTAELVEIRYSGNVASSLRFFKGIYFGILSNCIVMGWVMKAVSVFVKGALGWDPMITLIVLLAFTLLYTAASGMWGIVATDFIQFWISLAGTVLLAIFAMQYIGGVDGLIEGLTARYGEIKATSMLHFVPRFESAFFPIFIVFITLKWWSNPTEAVTQRIVSSKTPKDASLATFIFGLIHLGLNYWPMILVALVSLAVYPNLATADAEQGYVLLMVKLLPAGVLGLVLAALLAAFMSTIDTHVNCGAAFMINDIYRRFLHKGASKKHYVFASRVATVLMLILAVIIAYYLENVKTAWYWLSKLTAGYGFILVVRWFWWRINAWSEIAALFGSLAGSVFEALVLRRFYPDLAFGYQFLFVLCVSTACWLTVTFLTKPVEDERLRKFCELVRPYPFGWKPIASKYSGIDWNPHFKKNVFQFFVGSIAIYSISFALGSLLFKLYSNAAILAGIGAVSFAIILWTLRGNSLQEAA
jgi:SSS family solute:Na+ symporter